MGYIELLGTFTAFEIIAEVSHPIVPMALFSKCDYQIDGRQITLH
jgi:hypothetical protein